MRIACPARQTFRSAMFPIRRAGFNRSQTTPTAIKTVSISADGRSMVSIQRQQSDSVFVQPVRVNATPVQIQGLPNQAAVNSVGWDDHGNLLVATSTSVLRLSLDGSQQTTLVSDSSATITGMSACGTAGRFCWVGASRARAGDAEYLASRCRRVAPDAAFKWQHEVLPVCSPDGKWPYYLNVSASAPMRLACGWWIAGTRRRKRDSKRIRRRRKQFFAGRQMAPGDRYRG